MALSITHAKVSGKAAGSDPDRVYGTHWDAAHTLTGSVSVEQGGTGLTSYTIGDILYASTATALARLAGVATGSVLVSGGVGAAPAWSSSPTITDSVTAARFVPSGSTVPTNGMYLPAANTLGWAVNSAAELQLTASALSPAASDGNALGTSSLMWADLFLASGGVINWNNGDVTVTHSANALAFAGASSGYSFDAVVAPATSDGAALGSTSLMWSDIFLASGAVLNFNNGNYTVTHSSGLLTFSAGWAATGTTTLSSASANLPTAYLINSHDGASGPATIYRKYRAGAANNGAVQVNDSLGYGMFWEGYDQSGTPRTAAYVASFVQSVDASSVKGWIRFYAGGAISLEAYSTAVTIPLTTASTTHTNGALVVSGGLGVALDVFTNGIISSAGAHTALSGTAIPAGGTAGAGYKFSSTSNFGVFFGSGAPSLSAAKGSLYLRSDGSTTNDRAYINTNGSTTWTALTTVA